MQERKYKLGDHVLLERVNYNFKVEYYEYNLPYACSGSPSPMPNEWEITTVTDLYTYINEYLTSDGKAKKIINYSISFQSDSTKKNEADTWVKKFESNLHKDLFMDMVKLLKDQI